MINKAIRIHHNTLRVILPTCTSIVIFFAVFFVHSVTAQDYDALIQEAVAQRNLGELSAAERTLRQAYGIPADKSEVAYLLAMVIAFQERYHESISLLDQALTQAPDNISLRLGKARVRAFQGLLPEAAQLTDNVLQE